jgi:hypothetical protein
MLDGQDGLGLNPPARIRRPPAKKAHRKCRQFGHGSKVRFHSVCRLCNENEEGLAVLHQALV